MKEKKYCQIVQDLLPNYIEKLTNVETNIFVEEHLKECDNCKKILESMKKELNTTEEKIEEREAKYIKKFGRNFKILRNVLVVIILLIVIFGILITRKSIILADIDNKVSYYENNKQNIYTKSITNTNEYIMETENFIKGNVRKVVMKTKEKSGSELQVIEIDTDTKNKLYKDKDGNKILTENVYGEISPKPIRGSHIKDIEGNNAFASYTVLPNPVYADSLSQRILNSIFTKIKTVQIDGKECYEISGKYNYNLVYSENAKEVLLYIDKVTGLTIKKVEIVNENGKQIENITTYEYKFDCVTDEDLIEPDETQYKKM